MVELILSLATLSAVLAIVFGIIILLWPKALNLAVALWLIITGILQIISVAFPALSPPF